MVTVPEVPSSWQNDVCQPRADLVGRLDRHQQGLHPPHHALEGALVGLDRERLGERHHADRHRMDAAQHGRPPGRAAVEPQELRAAAADVDQQHVLGRRIDQRQAAEQGQARLVLVRQDLEGEAGHPLDAGEELDAVARAPAGLGRDAAQLAHVVAADDPGADPERRDRSRDRPLVEPAAAGDPLAEPHDAGEAVDHLERLATRLGHQQAAVVGAEIERSHRRPNRTRRPQSEVLGRSDHRTMAITVGHPAVIGHCFSALRRLGLWG